MKTTISLRQMRRDGLPDAQTAPPTWRPRVRGDCANGPRPCGFVGCRYHLWMDVTRHGALRFVGGTSVDQLTEMEETCALDVAENDGVSLTRIAHLLRMTHENVSLVIEAATKALRSREAGVLRTPCPEQCGASAKSDDDTQNLEALGFQGEEIPWLKHLCS